MVEKRIKEVIKIWTEFAKRQTTEKDKFVVNPDEEKVMQIAKGVLYNEKHYSLKYCPCRVLTGKKDEDLKLICPCNFKIQKTWTEKGECWCALFVRK